MNGRGTPSSWKDVSVVKTSPIVKGSTPAIKGYMDHLVFDFSNVGTADEVRILSVDSLQLLTHLELIHLGTCWLLFEAPDERVVGN